MAELLREPPAQGEYNTIIDPSFIPVPSPIFRSPKIPNTAKLIYATLRVLVNGDGPFGLEEIVAMSGTEPSVCQDAVLWLHRNGLINYDEQAGTLEIVGNHPIFIEGYLPKEK